MKNKWNKHKLFFGVKVAVSTILIFTLLLSVLTYITTPYIKPEENILSYESLVLENTQTEDELEIFDFMGEVNRSETLKAVCRVLRRNTYQYISKPKGLLLTLQVEKKENYLLTVSTEYLIGDVYTRIYDIYKYKGDYYILSFQHTSKSTFFNRTGSRMAVYKVANSELFKEIENYKKDVFMMKLFPFWLRSFI